VTSGSPYNLERFLEAQDPVYDLVCSELRSGRKKSHWMWFIFPQIVGLGSSHMATKFAIYSIDEARAYARHPILGARLTECTELVNQIAGRTISKIFGYPDDLKFRSCMTLFVIATGDPVFTQALQKYFAGEPDAQTLKLL